MSLDLNVRYLPTLRQKYAGMLLERLRGGSAGVKHQHSSVVHIQVKCTRVLPWPKQVSN